MIRKTGFLVVVAGLLLAVLSPVLAQTGAGPRILESSASVEFPARLSFSLEAESDVDITDIRLHYRVDRDSFARVTSEVIISFSPAASVAASWSLEMIKAGGMPSGAVVRYWWTVTDASGHSIETAPLQVQFDDDRYQWRSLVQGDITLYWYQGGESFAQEIMQTAQEALVRLAEDTGAYLVRPIKVYIYASSQDLLGAMIFPQEWTGGVAYTTYGTLAIGINPGILEWGKRAIVHELAHLVTYQMTSNPYNSLPTWLSEGLSVYAEGEPEAIYVAYLNQAILQGTLISVRSLSSPFSAFAAQSYLSYAQSRSLVDFMISQYGQDRMLELLGTFKQGSGYDAALMKVYGFDMDGLDALWRAYVVEKYQPDGGNTSAAPAGTPLVAAATSPAASGLVAEERLWSRAG
ncbi:MAG: peptidase MA family metallohydrolase [Dehalococcoidales bacterium]